MNVSRREGLCARLAVAGVFLLAGCSGGAGGGAQFEAPGEATTNYNVGDVVAEFELAAPDHSPFVLHGTVPVPAGMVRSSDSESPFTVRASGLDEVPTQVEIVSRYPSANDGADVVEVLARVVSPPNSVPGDRIRFKLLWSPIATQAQVVDAEVAALLNTPGALELRATDVFGHSYSADPLRDLRNNTSDLRTIRDGQLAHQVRTYENLVPVAPTAGPTGTLEHMMGTHAYITTWDGEPFFSLDLRFHNGHEGFDPFDLQDDPVGKLYFNELELLIPSGWKVFQAFETPSMGSMYVEGSSIVLPLVAPIGNGEMHMIPCQSQFHRRLIVCKDGSEARARAVLAEQGLAFCRDGENENGERLMSWWNPGTARYWGQNLPLPTLAYLKTDATFRAQLEGEFQAFETALANGTPGPWPNVTPNLGWAHPAGLSVGNAHGGHNIYWADGLEASWSASTEGYRSFQILHRMYTERHDTALYAANGDPYQLEKWLVEGQHGPYLPTFLFTVPWLILGDPHGFTSAPTFQVDAVELQGRKPAYEDALLNYNWINTAHLIRYTRSPKVLVWLGNDALAKDDMRMQAEISRSSWAPYPQDDNGGVIGTGQQMDMNFIAGHPRDGIRMDRAEGWIFDTAACYYALADDTWRAQTKAWFESVTDTIGAGQSACNGVIMSLPHSGHLNGNYRLLQSISEAIIQNGLWSIRTSVFAGDDPLYTAKLGQIITTSTTAMISPKFWNAAENNFHFYTGLGPFDQDLPTFCSYVPEDGYSGQDGWQTWNVLTFGYMLTGNPDFLTKAALMGGGTLTAPAIGGDTTPGELEVRAGMIALIQNL